MDFILHHNKITQECRTFNHYLKTYFIASFIILAEQGLPAYITANNIN